VIHAKSEQTIAARVRSSIDFEAENRSALLDDGRTLVSSLDRFVEESARLTMASKELSMVNDAQFELTGFGVLQPMLLDASIEEIWMNDHSRIFFAANGETRCVDSGLSAEAMENLIARLLRYSSKRVDRLHPFADAALPDGSRVHVAIAPAVARGVALNIRKFPSKVRSLASLRDLGMFDGKQLEQLRKVIADRRNFIVSGATNAGKTTLLAAMISELPGPHRVVSIEETQELRITNHDWVSLQGRPEGMGEAQPIDLRRLVRESLRMRPDQLVIGEVRGAEALELLLAMNSGIPAAGTIHAKSAAAALSKLMLLPTLAQANIDAAFIQSTVLAVVDFVIQIETVGGTRKIVEILEVGGK
jgi:pilus assembly protein CpaF